MAQNTASPDTSPAQTKEFYISAAQNEAAKVVVVGLGTGLLVALLGLLIARAFIVPVFCNSPDSFSVCASGGQVASYVSTIIVNIVAVVVMVRLSIYRPLLIALAAGISLITLHSYIGALSWFEYIFWFMMLYALGYAVFYWLARVRVFWISLIAIVLTVISARLLLGL